MEKEINFQKSEVLWEWCIHVFIEMNSAYYIVFTF